MLYFNKAKEQKCASHTSALLYSWRRCFCSARAIAHLSFCYPEKSGGLSWITKNIPEHKYMCSGTDVVIIRGTTRIESPVRRIPRLPFQFLSKYLTRTKRTSLLSFHGIPAILHFASMPDASASLLPSVPISPIPQKMLSVGDILFLSSSKD